MKMRNFLVSGGILASLFLSSCSKEPLAGLTEEDSRIYITNYDSTARFSNFNTFSVSDSVTVINNGQVSKQLTSVDLAFINATKEVMRSKGFSLVSKGDSPDVGVNVTRIYNTSTGVINYNDYFGGYGGFYDPYYWGYGGYGYYSPYQYATYTVREGALSIDILNLKQAASTNQIKVVWTGLIRGSGIFNAATAASQVNMLFQQSPYLTTH
ncbi:MAG: hypothetical protein JWQ96_2066 [Segetibacter sp.]|nr:hypothetical protein [Segetibacter sp.]